jgi:serine/threonine-protein kinase
VPREHESDTGIALADPLVGTIFDKRFRIDEKLAAGGFGAIYRATHVKSGHQVALKVLLPSLAQDLGVLARFRREGKTLTSLRSPHTITAYELGQAADRTLFIVLELLRGESLFDHYQSTGPLDWRRVARIASEVCESLEEAHGLGIIHRDLKPTNIHLEYHDDDPDFVKVLDFGIAKIIQGSDNLDSADITNAGQMIGTLDYMSPEQMVGGSVTGQTDIYTLGIVMYEMIAGCLPFPEATTAASALAAMLKTKPPPLRLRAPLPEELSVVVMRCLEREAQHRYATVKELRTDLMRVLAGASADAHTRSLDVGHHKHRPHGDDDDLDATTITPPPEQIIAALQAERSGLDPGPLEAVTRPGRRPVTPSPWDDDAPTTLPDDDDEDAPTITPMDRAADLLARGARAHAQAKARAYDEATRMADDTAPGPREEVDETAPRPRTSGEQPTRAEMPRSRPNSERPTWSRNDDKTRPLSESDLMPVRSRSDSALPTPRPGSVPRADGPVLPAPRPLDRLSPAPLPQLVAAPFSSSRTPVPGSPPPMQPMQPMHPGAMPPQPFGPPGYGPPPGSFVPGAVATPPGTYVPTPPAGFAPPPQGYGPMFPTPPPNQPIPGFTQGASYDMARMAARDTMVRRVVIVLALALTIGIGILLAKIF